MVVKSWKVEQIAQDILKYNWALVRNYYYKDSETMEDDAKLDVLNVVKETEKAMQVIVRCVTVGSEMDREYTTWIPKSCIIEG